MSEIAALESLESRLGLLRCTGTEPELLEYAEMFIRAAARELAQTDPGWGNVRAQGRWSYAGLDVSRLLHRDTLQMVRVVIGAGANGQHVGWEPVATGTPSQWVAAANVGATVLEAPPQTATELLEDIRDLLSEIENTTRALHAEQQATNAILRRADARGGV